MNYILYLTDEDGEQLAPDIPITHRLPIGTQVCLDDPYITAVVDRYNYHINSDTLYIIADTSRPWSPSPPDSKP